MTSVHPLCFVRFGYGGRKLERRPFSFLLSIVDEPVGDTGTRGLRVSKFLEVSEYLLSFFLFGSFACVMKIVYGIGPSQYQFQLRGIVQGGSPLRKVFPARENLNRWDFPVFDSPAVKYWPSPMAGGLG